MTQLKYDLRDVEVNYCLSLVYRQTRASAVVVCGTRADYTQTKSDAIRSPFPLLLVEGSWPSVHAANTHLIDHSDVKIRLEVNLAREANVVG